MTSGYKKPGILFDIRLPEDRITSCDIRLQNMIALCDIKLSEGKPFCIFRFSKTRFYVTLCRLIDFLRHLENRNA